MQPALDVYQQVPPGLTELAVQAQGIVDQARATLEPDRQFQRLRELWRLSTPDNWHDLDSAEHNVIDLVTASGICLVWAPRADILRQLLAEPDNTQRIELLGQAFDIIVEDSQAVLRTVTAVDDVEGHAAALAFASEALAAAADGHVHAAQALATAGLGAVVHEIWRYPMRGGLGEARRDFSARDLDKAAVEALKWTLIQLCTAKALKSTTEGTAGYNRHGTQHGVRCYFSAGSASEGLLLLVAWVKEISWLHERYPQMFGAEEAPAPSY